MAMYIQLGTGRTAKVDSAFWLTASEEEIDRFYERNAGFETDPLDVKLPSAEEEIPEEDI
jgi:hypothetical protein